MTELMTVQATGIQQREAISADLFRRFIEYTDREPTTTKGYITCLRQFFTWITATGRTQPQRADVIAYKEYLEGATFGRTGAEPLKAGTKQQYLRAVKHFFKWTASEGLYPNIADNIHGAKIRHDNHKKDALTLDETKTVEASIDRSTEAGKRLYAMYLLGARRGLRTVELSRANIKDLHRKGGTLYIDIWGKGHSEPDTTRALDPDTAAALEDYLQSRTDKTPGAPLFTSTSNRSKGQRIAPTTISTMLKAALVNAGFDSERLTAHSLRHTAGTMAVEQGDIYDAQRFLRHSDPKTTEIYTHVDDLERDKDLALKIYNAYHDSTGEAAQRQEIVSMIAALDPAQLQQVGAFIRGLQQVGA